MMQIQLISTDPDLYHFCRGILGEFCELSWTLSQLPDWETAGSADLHIWDYQPEMSFSDSVHRHLSRHLFLVRRAHLAGFWEKIGRGANVILQPASRAALASYLTLAVEPNPERAQAENALRADRDEMLQCLIQANLRLQEYDQDRTNFLSRAVHDFRAPLTALNGYCSLLLSEPLGELNEDQAEVIRRMQHSVKRLSGMANAMFELSVGRQMKRIPDLQVGDIRDCVDHAAHEIMPLAESKQISLSVDLTSYAPPLYFEPIKIEQVFVNLLDNACKFTRGPGEIEIRGYPFFWERREPRGKVVFSLDRRRHLSQEANSYRIDVRNSGAPIPNEQLKGIFEEYTSYGGSRDRSGAGLGLAICAMILRQHNGEIWAENTVSGPLFAVVLPIHRGELDVDKQMTASTELRRRL
jgi:signal transduction histidine kinase